ncbi:quinate permease [Sclerotinia borealis F-4128]|uniref:Quinate permease n=1 Tax=Sclerotinia borealis (strain F-4128) TaxID=1432307 RepID=W9C5V0_SCLBF|nr:quinate permease [Sclerotinia borealis F-4128]
MIANFHGKEKLSLPDRRNLRFPIKVSMAATLQFWQSWTGTNSIHYYSPQIFNMVGLKGTSAGLFATGIYGVVKVCITAWGLMFFATERVGRKWCLGIGGMGQAFDMFDIGINQAVNPPQKEMSDWYIAFAVSMVSRYAANPDEPHMKAVERIFCYPHGTLNFTLLFEGELKALSGTIFNAKVLFPFSTVTCLFSDDFGGAADILALWLTSLKRLATNIPPSANPKIFILGSAETPAFDGSKMTEKFISILSRDIAKRGGEKLSKSNPYGPTGTSGG